jgi:hypothetical protein
MFSKGIFLIMSENTNLTDYLGRRINKSYIVIDKKRFGIEKLDTCHIGLVFYCLFFR